MRFHQRYLSGSLQMELASNHALEARAGVQCGPVSKSKKKCQLMTKFQLGRLASAIARCRPISQGETLRIDPNSELRQVCCLHGPGSWTQCQRVSVVRRFPV